MENSSLIEILRSYSKEEMKRFTRFVESPYFNTSEATAKLIIEIAKYHPEFESKNLSKEKLFEKVYGNKNFSDNLIRKLVSNLLKLVEVFLTVENQIHKEYSLIKGLREKKLYNNISKKITNKNESSNILLINEDEFLSRALVEGEKGFFYYETDRYQEFEESKARTFNYHSLFYFYSLAQNTIKAKNKIANRKFRVSSIAEHINSSIDLKKLKKAVENENIENSPTFIHLLDIMLLYITKDEKLYRKIKEFAFQYSSEYPEEIIYIGYVYLAKFAEEQLNNGEVKYLNELHEIFKKIEFDYYSNNVASITLLQFNKLFFTGIKTGDIKFSEYVLDKYISKIESKGNPGLNRLYRAWIHFYQGKFEESLKSISIFNTAGYTLDDFILIQHVKQITLQVFYELGYYEEANNYLESFSRFLKTNKEINLNFINTYNKFAANYRHLLLYKLKNKPFNLQLIERSLGNGISIGKSWLLQKIEEIKKEQA